jgi:type I restriction enzyme, S subunit
VREGWEIKPLGEVCTLQRGFDLPKSERIEGRYPLVSSSGVIDTHSECMVRAPGVATGRSGSIGSVFYIDDDFWPLNTVLYVKDFHGNDPRFVYYLLTHFDLSRYAGGAGVPTLNRNSVQDVPVRVSTSLHEQQRIVAVLDEVFVGLAIATANAEKNLKNTRELFDSYLNSVFAEDWDEQLLGDICENLDSRRIPVTKKGRNIGHIPYYGASGAVDHVADFIFCEDLLLVSEDGANLVTRTYPIAFSISGKSWVNNHAHVLRFPDLASQRFVEHYLNSISLTPYVNGMAQPKLNQRALNSIPIPSPTVYERQQAVTRLDDLAARTERLRDGYETRIAAIAELKQSVLQKCFSGQLILPSSQAVKEAAE